ncbi:helix-turn-helix domain-containing protein [Mangrovimonas aestuarii]|uniref:helix-turn-helix domain-containing protein n=1 Tax=Mangrovimonas aestuarii TaxID=3018443 RepID=UPI0023794AC7|nr:helix-turn-helix domain-containing protein [Mangrovimonas aestuarii]
MINHYTTYTNCYKEIYKETENDLKEILIECNKEYRPFNFANNKCLEELSKRCNTIRSKVQPHYPNSLRVFNDRASFYNKQDIKLIIQNELNQSFVEENINKTISFEDFIIDIAALEAFVNAKVIFTQNQEFNENMYLLNNFKHFKLIYFRRNEILTKLNIVFREKLYGKPVDNALFAPEKTDKKQENTFKSLVQNGTPEKVFLDINEAAALLGKAKQTIYGLVNRKQIPFHKKGNKLYFIREELIEWVTKEKPIKKSATEKLDDFLSR